MPNIYTTVTVDWEGRDLDDIAAMQHFNNTFPTIPLTHFICPAYLTRLSDPAARMAVGQKISSAIKDIDEVGLHIHCWYSLMYFANMNLVFTRPTWYANDGPGQCVATPGARWGDEDCGHGVPFGYYSVANMVRILAQSQKLLMYAGVKNTTLFNSFRCGGWLATDDVFTVVNQEGFRCEASAAPSAYFSQVVQPIFQDLPVIDWVAQMWSGGVQVAPRWRRNTLCAQVYPNGVQGLYPIAPTTAISDPARMQNMVQIPDTGALADYTPEDTLNEYVAAAINRANGGEDVYISMGWHEDSATLASRFHPKVPNIVVIMNVINANPGRLTFLTVDQARQMWQNAHLPTPVFPREEELVRLEHPVTLPKIPVTGEGIIFG